jgi:MinD-like ATPase involved in chromosome partitioning or flagellar assembly
MPVLPSLSTVVTSTFDATWGAIDRYTRLAPSGLRLIPAPPGAAEAQRAVVESARALVPALCSLRSPVAIVDAGDLAGASGANPFVTSAAVVVLVHRQRTQSARAAAVRLQRMADHLDAMPSGSASVVVAIVGAEPFDLAQIASFVEESVGSTPIVGLPVDTLTAAVYAGHTGVSARRLARLPLTRAARELAQVVDATLQDRVGSLGRSAR